MKLIKQISVFILSCTILITASCSAASSVSSKIKEPEDNTAILNTDSQTSPETETLSFLQQEKLSDPIFDWVDPYSDLSDKEIDKLQTTLSEEEYTDYMTQKYCYNLAKENYTLYYYYYSGRSEFDGTKLKANNGYDLSGSIASYAVPESFILNMCADACVIMHAEEAYKVTVERTYENEEVKEKDQSQGTPSTYEATRFIYKIDKCLWGDMEGNTDVYIVPRLVSSDFIDIMSDTNKTFVAFLWKSDNTTEYKGTTYQEYGFVVRSIFDYTDGTLKAYSNIADVAEYDGKTAEEMIETGEALAVKYPDIISEFK